MSEGTGDDRKWYCLRTQVKREQLAMAALEEFEGIEAICPRLRYKKVTRRGKVWWVEPLFPGYLLAKFSLAKQMRAVSYAKGVSRILQFGDQTPEVPESFVEELKAELARQASEDGTIVVQPAVEPGDEVELAEGPLRGMTGRVIEVRPAEERVRIFIEFLGQEQPVDVDLFSLLLPKHPVPGDPGLG